MEDTSQQVDSGITAWMNCVAVNIIWKIIHSRWTVVLQVEWSVLQWTLYGRYFTAGGQWYYRLNGVCYSEHYMEDTSQQVESSITVWTKCVSVNNIWKILHSRWAVVLQVEWCVLQWTLYGRYFTAGGQWYCRLNELCFSVHYLEDTSQQVDSGIAVWMECVAVNIIWEIIHSKWTVVLQLEFSLLQWTLYGTYCTAGGQWYCSLNGVTVNIIWKVLHSWWTVVLQVERIVLQWTLSGRYFTAGGQWHCSLNVVCCWEHYTEDTSQQVDSGITGWMECVTVNIIWMILHRRWTVVLQFEWSVLLWILYGRYFTAGGQWYFGLNGVCYSERYMEDISQQVDSGIADWM